MEECENYSHSYYWQAFNVLVHRHYACESPAFLSPQRGLCQPPRSADSPTLTPGVASHHFQLLQCQVQFCSTTQENQDNIRSPQLLEHIDGVVIKLYKKGKVYLLFAYSNPYPQRWQGIDEFIVHMVIFCKPEQKIYSTQMPEQVKGLKVECCMCQSAVLILSRNKVLAKNGISQLNQKLV